MGYQLLKRVWWGRVGGGFSDAHLWGNNSFLTITVSEIDLQFSFFVLKSVKYKFLDLHRLKLIHFNFVVLSNKKYINGRFAFSLG